MKPKRQIEVSKQVREMLVKEFNTTSVSVWRALSFRDNSPKSKRIRCAAYKNRGILLLLTPAMETIHDADNFMRQYFPNDVLIEANKNTGHIELQKCGEVVKCWDDVPFRKIGDIQQEAVKLCGCHVEL
jgi:hypothetical protein